MTKLICPICCVEESCMGDLLSHLRKHTKIQLAAKILHNLAGIERDVNCG